MSTLIGTLSQIFSIFYFDASPMISRNYLKMFGFSNKNDRYSRYKDTDFLQLCFIRLAENSGPLLSLPVDCLTATGRAKRPPKLKTALFMRMCVLLVVITVACIFHIYP